MKMKLHLILLATIAIFAVLSCTKKIEGTVYDNFDQPLSEVNVSITGTSYQSKTDKAGKYNIDYAPGSINLNFDKQGYTSENLSINITSKVSFPAEKKVMMKKPNASGVFFIDKKAKDYISINQGTFRKDHWNNPANAWATGYQIPSAINSFYCLGDYTSITADSNKTDFIINLPDRLNLIQIQKDDGFFYKYEEYGMNYKYSSIKPNISCTTKENFIMYSGNLNKGKYCFIAIDKNNRPLNPVYNFEVK